jgi:hypothetical protein
VTGGGHAQLHCPRARIDQVGDHDDAATASCRCSGAVNGVGERRRAGRGLVGLRSALQASQQVEHRVAPVTRWDDGGARAVEHECRGAIPAPCTEQTERRRSGQRKIALLPVRRAEVEAGAGVDDQPGLQLAFRNRLAQVHVM